MKPIRDNPIEDGVDYFFEEKQRLKEEKQKLENEIREYEQDYLDQYYDRLEEERKFNLEFDRELWEDEVL